jgi:glycine cleavage system H lipoate-binding protein
MRAIIVLIGFTAFLFAGVANVDADNKGNRKPGENPVRVVTSPDLETIAGIWVDAYNSTSPGIPVFLGLMLDNRLDEVIRDEGTIALVSQKDLSGHVPEDAWCMVVGRDVIVPVMNRDNPFREQLMRQGISPGAFAGVYTSSGVPGWGMVLGNEASEPVHAYAFGSRTCLSYLAGFMDTEPEYITARTVTSKEEMLDRLREDRYAIGFCRLSEMARMEKRGTECGLCLIPVDLNGNRRIDNFEHIYDCTGDLSRGIWIGKYPGELYNKLYTVAGYEPTAGGQVAFLEWVVTEGQQYLATSDYSPLVSSEKLSSSKRIKVTGTPVPEVPVRNAPAAIIPVVMGALLAGVLVFLLGIRFASRRKGEPAAKKPGPSYISEAGGVTVREGLFFDRTHTWVFMEQGGRVRVGIDDFLQHITGRITRVEMKRGGEKVKKGEIFLTLVQQGKKLNIQSPVSGIIKAHNPELELKPDLVNAFPCCDGWIYEVEPSRWLQEIRAFLMGDSYREWIRTEFGRLKEFLASGLESLKVPGEEPVLQDGGAVRDGVMEYFGPEAWEEFQSGFMNTPVK